MIEGVLRHCTEMEIEKNYVDSHGQSEVAFAFCRLLGFHLLPRLKAIHAQKLYRPETGRPEAYPNLQPVLTRPIDWDLIERQYDEMVKYATALRLGTAEPRTILRRFTRNNVQHPTYKALAELGKADQDDVPVPLFALAFIATRDPRRAERGRELEQCQRLHLYGKGGEIATQPRRGSRDYRASAAPAAGQPGLHQHADDPTCAERVSLGGPDDSGG